MVVCHIPMKFVVFFRDILGAMLFQLFLSFNFVLKRLDFGCKRLTFITIFNTLKPSLEITLEKREEEEVRLGKGNGLETNREIGTPAQV